MDDLKPIFEGKIPVPNLEIIEPEKGLGQLIYGWGDGGIGRARIDPKSSYGVQARFFYGHEGMGWMSGEGLVIWTDYIHEPEYKAVTRIARFAICKHQRVEGPGANHSRGWHPAFCGLCGMDMSVDSGD